MRKRSVSFKKKSLENTNRTANSSGSAGKKKILRNTEISLVRGR